MAMLIPRETFIALRARRQAHQIASEILNPHIKSDRPADAPKTPLQIELPPLVRRTMSPIDRWIMLILTAIGIGSMATVFLYWFKVH